MKSKFIKISVLFAAIVITLSAIPFASFAQMDDPTTQTSVWEVTFVRLKPHQGAKYMQGLKKTWAASMEESVKAGLVKSYMILGSSATNRGDFDLMLMVEFPGYSSFDPNPEREKKYEEIEKKIRDAMGDEYQKTVDGYNDMREITGIKVLSELKFK